MDELFDIPSFLNDIEGDHPEGQNLRYTGAYDKIREACREEPNLPQGIWVRDIKIADWQETQTLCESALKTQSKDLQIAAWLIEAWFSQYDIQGLQSGLELMLELSQKYWDTAYPKIDETGDLEYRMSPYIWINEKLATRTQKIRITAPEGTGERRYTMGNWIDVSRLQDLYQQGDRPQSSAPLEQVGAAKIPTLLDFDTSLQKTPTAFYTDLQQSVSACITLCKLIESFLDEKCGPEAPSLYRMNDALANFQKFLTQTLADRGLVNPLVSPPLNPQNPAEEGVVSPQASSNPLPLVKGVPMSNEAPSSFQSFHLSSAMDQSTSTFLQNRDEAYRQINEAADYLAAIEPHSPVPFLIKRAVSWRNKSFMDLMKEMVQDPNGISDINRLLGLPSDSSS
jgi:type VI secretion system ImpA family protein